LILSTDNALSLPSPRQQRCTDESQEPSAVMTAVF
jgi:hypothetical protein